MTAIKSPNVRAVVAFEPGSSFVFAKDDAPAPIPSAFDTVAPVVVSPEEFKVLTRIPILVLYGDNIPESRCACPRRTAGERAQMAGAA